MEMKEPFRYSPDNMSMWDTRDAVTHHRRYSHHTLIKSAILRKDTCTSMWELDCFVEGFVEWVNDQLKGDCYYSTYEEIRDGKALRWFSLYFENERDAVLLKLFWQ
jgi:hypothetical protein